MSIQHLRPADFADWTQSHSGGPQPPILLDVREPWEIAIARTEPHGVQLVHIPMQQLPASLAQLPTDAPIAVLCHHGVRSLHVASYLVQQGYEQVFNVAGGIHAWSGFTPEIPVY